MSEAEDRRKMAEIEKAMTPLELTLHIQISIFYMFVVIGKIITTLRQLNFEDPDKDPDQDDRRQ